MQGGLIPFPVPATRAQTVRSWAVLVALALVGSVLLVLLVIVGQERLAIMAAIAAALLALALIDIRLAVLAGFVYLVLMGDFRRMLIPFFGWSGSDPLLLVGAMMSALFVGFAAASRSVRIDTPLARWVLLLMGIMVLQMFNPKQGGLVIGIAGALFYMVPLLWFWIGRTYATSAMLHTLFYRLVIPLAVLAALLGFYQTFYGYLPYQEQWYDIAGYTALGAKGIEAPISFFASSTEYSNFLIIAIVLLWAQVVLRKQRAALLLILPLLAAVFLIGSRGPIVKVLVTIVILWAIMGRTKSTWIARGVLALLIAGVGLTWSLSQVEHIGGNARVQHRVQRQAEGLVNATQQGSSAMIHLTMMVNGYKVAIQEPLGRGLGATTKAASKFGGRAKSTEVDFTNVLVSTGLIGGAIYHLIIGLIILTALRYWIRTRSLLAMGLVGLLAVMFLLWLKGGQYAVSTLLWFSIGALDRLYRDTAPASEVQKEGTL